VTTTEIGVGYEMTITRNFAAPRELVFDCFTKAEHLARWWGPREFDAPVCETDARPGGKIRIDMRGPDPFGTNPVYGEYLEIARPDRLRFVLRAFQESDGSWGIEHEDTLVFEDAPDGGTVLHMVTRVTQVSERMLPALNGMKEGWSQSLDKLEELLPELV
jgi:uncharacterized protein YndB with AHSA1/START domain